MDTKPMHNGHYLQSLLGVFAPRIVAEIERRRAEQERLQALYDLRNITETIPDVMFTLDTQGNLVKWNRRLGDVTGYSAEELLNKPALVFVPAEERDRTAAAIQRAFTEGYAELDGHLLTKDLRTIPYHWIGALLRSPHGEIIGITGVGRDVSDKKRMEAELTRQRGHLVDAQALAHLGSWDWDVSTGEVKWSDEQFRIFGHEPGSISVTYDTFIASLHPADQAIVEAAFNDALLGKCVYNVEYRVVRPNGEVRFVHARGDVHRDVTGSPLSMAGTVLDITERYEAETAMRDQEQLLRTVIETATDAIFMKDAEGRYLLINSAGAEVIGKAVDQIVGRDDRELFPPRVAARLIANDRQVMSGSEQARFEAILHFNGGSRVFYSVKTPHRNRQGKVIGLVGVSRDVTELKQAEERLRQSEERYRALYDDTPTMYFTLATDGTVLSVNRFGAEQLGYQVEELIGHSVLGIFYDEDKETVAASLSECLATPETTRHWEFRKVRKDGTIIWVQETAHVGQSSTGETVVLVSCEDITERRRMEEALAQLNATLEQQVNDRTEALRSSEERLKQAVEVADLGIFEHDHSADTIEISTRLRAMYGWDTESPISLQEIIACVFPLDREGLAAAIKLAHDPAGDGCLAHEHRVVWSDGSIHWLSVRAQTWFAGDGSDRRPSRTLGAVCNITERKKAEEALAQVNVVLEKEVANRTRDLFQSEQAIRALHEATAAPGLSFDERMQAVLEVGCRRFSLPIGMLTRVVDEKLEFTHVYAPGTTFTAGMTVPLDVSYCKTPLQVADPTCFEQAGASVCRNHLEYKALGLECYLWTEMIGQDRLYGTVCFADHPPRLAAFSQADKDFLQLMARWISGELDRRMAELALKQSEERYRALYDDTPTMYFTLGKDGIVLSVNRFGAEQLGYRVEELVGHSVLDVFYNEDKETVAASLSECLATPE
ncbi:MAG TPA: PAS domain S-box protein, partial [Blastocatellia bacterium]|nr:PAS domain S-box protein [Blastocatellia bacterium]